jgi:hypothetical protein
MLLYPFFVYLYGDSIAEVLPLSFDTPCIAASCYVSLASNTRRQYKNNGPSHMNTPAYTWDFNNKAKWEQMSTAVYLQIKSLTSDDGHIDRNI